MTRYAPNMTDAALATAMRSELAELQRRYPSTTSAQSRLVLMGRMVRLQRDLEKLAR
jgi:hypothetical protein|tara:strand:+ start:2286 stop:2456 length:171 start_codon:yes stop_codon:yes gene_type:complete